MSGQEVTPGLCIRQSFPLFEQFAEACQGWDMDYRQLDAAPSPFQLEQLSTSQMLYGRAYFGSHFHQLGGPVLGFRTFALRSSDCTALRWCGEVVNRHSLIMFPADGEFESVSLPGFDIFTLSLSNTLLERTAEIQFQRPLSAFMGSGGKVCHLAGARVGELRTLLYRLSSDVGRAVALGALPYAAPMLRHLERTLAQLVLACLESGQSQLLRGPRSKRMKALGRALELVEQQPSPALGVAELVAQAGVSRRTLEHAFQDGLGVTPASYLKSTRLRALHKDLLAADVVSTSVHSLCAGYGFTHMGQLAADYHKLFGELPSVTLRRI